MTLLDLFSHRDFLNGARIFWNQKSFCVILDEFIKLPTWKSPYLLHDARLYLCTNRDITNFVIQFRNFHKWRRLTIKNIDTQFLIFPYVAKRNQFL